MSTTIDDYNNDGWLDIYVSNEDQVIEGTTTGNALLLNNGDGTFSNRAVETGTQFNSVGWGCVFLDAENDGDKDLYVSSSETGNNDLLTAAFYEQLSSETFVIPDIPGMKEDIRQSFANAIGDVDNDGYPEIGVVNDRNEDIFLWKNVTPTSNNYLKIKLEGAESNRMGIGSWIEISINGEKQYNYTLCGEGYLGQNSSYEFFGIGDATTVDYVKVSWLSGQVDLIEDVAANQSLTIVEGDSPLSVDESILAQNQIDIFPNPSRDIIQIKNQIPFGNDAKVILYDISGRSIRSFDLVPTGTDITLPIDFLKQGTYFLKFVDANGLTTAQHKLIKL